VTPRVATSPSSYGVLERTVGRAGLPDGPALAEAIADGGYAGCELGPPGYLGEGREAGKLLADCGLELVAASLPLRLAREEGLAEDMRGLDDALGLLSDAADGGALPLLLLADAVCEPDRMRLAGAIERHREAWPGERRQRLLIDNAHRAAEHCRERGFSVSFHPHAGSYVETPREVYALLENMDTNLLGLCFDVAHSAFGGGDPLALLRDAREVVDHAQLTDVDFELLERLRDQGAGFEQAVSAGAFCELGSGGAQLDDCLAQITGAGYDGWIVVEQERELAADEDFDRLLEAAERNRAWLRARGI
jgi:inosose dehydratase